MGRGDIKTKKGKISTGSYGVLRPHKKKKPIAVVSKPKKATAKEATAEKPPKPTTKKVATKKKDE